MADVPIPRNHNYRVSAFKQLTEVNRWASEIDARIVEILKSLGETTKRVNVLTTRSTPTTIGSHAPQHYPGTGLDPMLTTAHTGGYGMSTTVGTGDNLLRADATLRHPTILAEYSSNTTLTLSAVAATAQVLTGSMGELRIRSGSTTMSLDKYCGAGGSAGAVGTILTFDSTSSNIGTLTTGIRAQMAWNDGTYVSAALRGAFIQTNTNNGGSYTTSNVTTLDVVMLTSGNVTGTNSFDKRTTLRIQSGPALGAGMTVGEMYGIEMTTWPTIGTLGTYSNVIGAKLTMPTFGSSVRRGVWIDTQTSNLGTEATDAEVLYLSACNRGTTNRNSVYITGSATGTPTNVYGVQVASHGVGTNRWAYWGSNKYHCDASDYICNTTAKGLITKDAQGTARYWRIHADSTGTTSVSGTMSVDVNSILTVTRGATPAGTINLNLVDVGTAAPTT